jgi:hypothetical protein
MPDETIDLRDEVSERVSYTLTTFDDAPPGEADRDVLRAAIITALDILRRYQKMASLAQDKRIRRILQEGVREEEGRVRKLGTILLQGEKTQETTMDLKKISTLIT